MLNTTRNTTKIKLCCRDSAPLPPIRGPLCTARAEVCKGDDRWGRCVKVVTSLTGSMKVKRRNQWLHAAYLQPQRQWGWPPGTTAGGLTQGHRAQAATPSKKVSLTVQPKGGRPDNATVENPNGVFFTQFSSALQAPATHEPLSAGHITRTGLKFISQKPFFTLQPERRYGARCTDTAHGPPNTRGRTHSSRSSSQSGAVRPNILLSFYATLPKK